MKWIGWLAKLCATVVIVSLLTVMTTGYVVNMYIQSLLDSYNLPLTAQTPTLGGMMKGMLGFGGGKASGSDQNGEEKSANGKAGSTEDGKSAAGTEEDLSVADKEAGNGTGSHTGNPDAKGNGSNAGVNSDEGAVTEPAGTPDGEQPPEDALSVMGGISAGAGLGGQDALGQDQQVVVTPDEMEAKKDGLSDKEKEEVFTLLMSKLPQEEMQKMTAAMEDGLTEAEMIEIEQILSKYLDKAEYAKIIKILQG